MKPAGSRSVLHSRSLLSTAVDSEHVEVDHQVGFQLWICMRNERRKNEFNDQQTAVWPVFINAGNKVLCLGDPVTIGGTANINSLSVFDVVYSSVRGKPFAGR